MKILPFISKFPFNLLFSIGMLLAPLDVSAGTIYTIGDSTMADKPLDGGNPERGWVQGLRSYLKDSNVIDNHAKNGRSSRSFINEGRWNTVLQSLKKGDWLLIQFGHNDQKSHDPKRYTNPYSAYRHNLEKFVIEARSKGATPILISSVVRRNFNEEGTLIDTHGAYPFVVKAVSDALNVDFIDLQLGTEKLLQHTGVEASRRLFMNYQAGEHPFFPEGKTDNTHFNQLGADQVARLFLNMIREKGLKLSDYFEHPQSTLEIWSKDELHNISFAQPQEIYEGGIKTVHIPKLHVSLVNSKDKSPAILILPGGGYGHLSMEKEGFNVARWMNSLGLTAFVLEYRHSPYRQPIPLKDAQKALSLIRENAEKWNIDPNKVGIMGFSAGGHLASTCLTWWNKPVIESNVSLRPDFGILAYPVISLMDENLVHKGSRRNLLGEDFDDALKAEYSAELNIKSNPVPTFLFHAIDDGAVPVGNSEVYEAATLKAGGNAILHKEETGGHGFGLSKAESVKACEQFLRDLEIL